jgi:hypothetical protein
VTVDLPYALLHFCPFPFPAAQRRRKILQMSAGPAFGGGDAESGWVGSPKMDVSAKRPYQVRGTRFICLYDHLLASDARDSRGSANRSK